MTSIKFDLRDVLSKCIGAPVKNVKRKRLASLWAGYGEIERLSLQFGHAPTPATPLPATLIMKTVAPPPGVSGPELVGHERKMKSYTVEASFYKSHAQGLIDGPSPLRLPRPIFIDAQPPSRFTFILSDLDQGSFRPSRGNMSMAQLQTALDWLACLHARYHGDSLPTDLWPVGGFWHLETRQQELASMGAEWAALKSLAPSLDLYLRGLHPASTAAQRCGDPGTDSSQHGRSPPSSLPRHATILHGDFKSENLMFGVADDGSPACAAYDFQYCGAGYGARDVVYLFCSSTTDRLLSPSGEEHLLRHYYTALQRELRTLGKDVDADDYTFELMMDHFEVSLLDYLRFMAGWGWWGAVGWARKRGESLLPVWTQRLM
ncbi:MAG: hypothetical protein WDW38_004725 [Sanguina aurantia]